MNLAKSLIVSEKNFFNHRAPMQWNGSFGPKISQIFAFRQAWLIRYSRTKNAVLFYLRNRTTAQMEYVMGCTVTNVRNFEYLNSLSLRDTHRFKKAKYWNIPHLSRWKEEKHLPVGTPRLTNQTLNRWRKLQLKVYLRIRTADLNTDHLSWISWKFGQILSI
jgi:hypothetical protein